MSMLCSHCNHNEAEYRFFLSYMGRIVEINLCPDCLEELKKQFLSFQKAFAGNSAWQAAWPGFLMGTQGINKPGGGSDMADPKEREVFPLDAGCEIRDRRRLNELRARLSRAIELEEYETAAQLRDEIVKMEKGVHIYDA